MSYTELPDPVINNSPENEEPENSKRPSSPNNEHVSSPQPRSPQPQHPHQMHHPQTTSNVRNNMNRPNYSSMPQGQKKRERMPTPVSNEPKRQRIDNTSHIPYPNVGQHATAGHQPPGSPSHPGMPTPMPPPQPQPGGMNPNLPPVQMNPGNEVQKAYIFYQNRVIPLVHVPFNTLDEFKQQLCIFLSIPPNYEVQLYRQDNNNPILTLEEKRDAADGILVEPVLKKNVYQPQYGVPANYGYPPGMPQNRNWGYPSHVKPPIPHGDLARDQREISIAKQKDPEAMSAKLPSSKTPVMDAFLYCALCDWGVSLNPNDGRNTTFSFTNYEEFWQRSRQVCSKRTPTQAEVSRLKSLRRWFMDLPGFKELKSVKSTNPPILVRVKEDRTDKIRNMIKKMRQVLNNRVKTILSDKGPIHPPQYHHA